MRKACDFIFFCFGLLIAPFQYIRTRCLLKFKFIFSACRITCEFFFPIIERIIIIFRCTKKIQHLWTHVNVSCVATLLLKSRCRKSASSTILHSIKLEYGVKWSYRRHDLTIFKFVFAQLRWKMPIWFERIAMKLAQLLSGLQNLVRVCTFTCGNIKWMVTFLFID